MKCTEITRDIDQENVRIKFLAYKRRFYPSEFRHFIGLNVQKSLRTKASNLGTLS